MADRKNNNTGCTVQRPIRGKMPIANSKMDWDVDSQDEGVK